MRNRVLLSGYYGFGNAGDEAVLAAAVSMFRDRRPDLTLCALSADPAGTRAAHGIDAVPRMQPSVLLAETRRCGLFLSGGGSLLQDRTSLKSLLYYLFVLALARRAGARTMVFAQGIGPLTRPAARRLAARALSQVDAITVRDADSAALLAEIGVDTKRTSPEVTSDLVFALSPRPTDRVAAASAERPAMAISLRPWDGAEALLDPLAEALAPFARRVSLQAWGLQPLEDLPLCEALARRLPAVRILRAPLEPGEWAALAGRKDLVLGMRLHALIFAAARGTPVLGISYDPKVDALLQRIDAPRLAGVPPRPGEGVEPDLLRRAVEEALAREPDALAAREARAAELRRLAARNVERALELL